MLNKKSKIFVAGHNGMVGSAILRKLKNLKYEKIFFRSKKQLDLMVINGSNGRTKPYLNFYDIGYV